MSKIRMLFLSVLIGSIVLAAGGCGAKKTVYKGKEGEVTVKEQSRGQDRETTVKVETKEGDTTIIGGATMPEDWPEDMPVYKPSELTSSTRIDNPQGSNSAIVLKTKDKVDQVKSYYETELKAKGWNAESSMTTSGDKGPVALIAVSKGERRANVAAAAEDGGFVTITITITEMAQ